MRLTVIKVGGSLLRGARELEAVAARIAERRRGGEALLVVASAFHGVTDLLERAALRALDPAGGRTACRRLLDDLRRRHEELAALVDAKTVLPRIEELLDEVERHFGDLSGPEELTESAWARLLSSGERLAVPLVAAAVRRAGHDARAVASEDLGLRVRRGPTAGLFDLARSEAGLGRIRPELRERVIVLTGFYGVDGEGAPVLFGRGGSDTTAGAVAAGLAADDLEMWKDVPGFLSADPHWVRDARLIPELSFDEAVQLGTYGARVLHPESLAPLYGRATRVCLRAPGEPRCGTVVAESRRRASGEVAGLAARRGRAEVRLDEDALTAAPGLAGEVLGGLAEADLRIGRRPDHGASLSFTVDAGQVPRVQAALERLTGRREKVAIDIRRHPARIGVVGDGVHLDGDLPRRIRTRLADTGLRGAVVLPESRRPVICCTVHDEDLEAALVALHDLFFAPSAAAEDVGIGAHGDSPLAPQASVS